ncbi:MAG: hypothetical protein WCB14_14650, partial [Candidatus Acidiferrales bacterium]
MQRNSHEGSGRSPQADNLREQLACVAAPACGNVSSCVAEFVAMWAQRRQPEQIFLQAAPGCPAHACARGH